MLTPFYFSMNFIVMELSALTAISPLDGRYGRQTAELRDIFSEFALMRARVTVEVEWLIALSEFNLPELKDLSEEDKLYLRGLVSSFSVADCQAIKDIEKTTNHDVKAVEWFDEVLIVLPEGREIPQKVFDAFAEMGITIHVKIADVNEMQGKNQTVERMGNYTVVTTCINMASAGQLVLKRIMDICGGLAGCILTGIIFLFVAPAIYIKSPGPIFFSQYRVGKNGRKFKIYKFRSMYMDAEERKKELMKQNRVSDGLMFKMENDPRVIGSEKGPGKGIGNFIRKTSLDEFPQFFNVLKGDMSLVGTRPPTVDEWEKYELHHRARLAIKPGLTGMWQVSGRSEITDFEEVVKLDTKYISEWSFMLDIKILFKTVLIVLGQKGSM